jgi:Fuc2NAc and GlcNAc transferase
MGTFWWLSGVLATVVSALIAALVAKHADRFGLLDQPNSRSSHEVPTPRGGGIAIVVTSSVGFLVLSGLGVLDESLAMSLVGGGLAVALAGLLDDLRRIPIIARLAVHIAAASWAIYQLGDTPVLNLGGVSVELTGIWYAISALAIVWVINLFNFMDGIDGLATSEAVFVVLAASLLAIPMQLTSGMSVVAILFVGSCLGFLYWNWSPARIFLGDVGSGYLGYVIAVYALSTSVDSNGDLLVWLILGAAFIVDATVTLIRRLCRGERVYVAHRSHAYQWLARRWRSHRRATLMMIAINVFLLLPLAVWSILQPRFAAWVAAGAFLILLVAFLAAGAGRAEETKH